MTEIDLSDVSDEALEMFKDMAQVSLLNPATDPEEKVKLGHTLRLLALEQDFRKELDAQDRIDDVEY
jgi:hypothetical protein